MLYEAIWSAKSTIMSNDVQGSVKMNKQTDAQPQNSARTGRKQQKFSKNSLSTFRKLLLPKNVQDTVQFFLSSETNASRSLVVRRLEEVGHNLEKNHVNLK